MSWELALGIFILMVVLLIGRNLVERSVIKEIRKILIKRRVLGRGRAG